MSRAAEGGREDHNAGGERGGKGPQRVRRKRGERPTPRARRVGKHDHNASAPRRAVAVPRDAVQRVMGQDVVFVRSARGVYEPRVVRRRSDGDPVQVEGGVQEGDAVVTAGAILLRTEVTPGSIGAGCCEVE